MTGDFTFIFDTLFSNTLSFNLYKKTHEISGAVSLLQMNKLRLIRIKELAYRSV